MGARLSRTLCDILYFALVAETLGEPPLRRRVGLHLDSGSGGDQRVKLKDEVGQGRKGDPEGSRAGRSVGGWSTGRLGTDERCRGVIGAWVDAAMQDAECT